MYGRGAGPGYRGGYRGSGLGIGPGTTPPIVKRLLIANFVVFAFQFLTSAGRGFGPLEELFAVRPLLVWQHGYLWQPFTYMWLHSVHQPFHILMNMFLLWMFGSPVAMLWGPRRFLRFYLACGVGAGFIISLFPYLLVAFGWPAAQLAYPTLGASGAIYGVILAYSLTWPDRTIMLIFPPVAFRAIWLIPVMFFLTLLFGGANVSHIGHLGGLLVAWLWLRRSGEAGRGLLSPSRLRYHWHRFRMRRRLRAVRREDDVRRRDRTFH